MTRQLQSAAARSRPRDRIDGDKIGDAQMATCKSVVETKTGRSVALMISDEEEEGWRARKSSDEKREKRKTELDEKREKRKGEGEATSPKGEKLAMSLGSEQRRWRQW
ncbi:hypothetical protein HN873_005109 [Arachis hypogaea]|nr:uncharacterized protein DS421_2g50280 [Arachis hypogaea]